MGITQELIHTLLEYEPDTGILRWRKGSGRRTGKSAGTPSEFGALHISVRGFRTYVHRVIWIMHNGPIPKKYVVDHIDHDPLNNRLANLRLIPWGLNQRNMKLSKANHSGHVGVDYHKPIQKWRAKIMVNRRSLHLGYFDTKDAAILARKAANTQYGFHPNHGVKSKVA